MGNSLQEASVFRKPETPITDRVPNSHTMAEAARVGDTRFLCWCIDAGLEFDERVFEAALEGKQTATVEWLLAYDLIRWHDKEEGVPLTWHVMAKNLDIDVNLLNLIPQKNK